MFGPVATVHPYETEAEALQLANATPYGLEGYVVGTDTDAALAFARRVRAGEVKVNGSSIMSLHLMTPRPAWGWSGMGEEGTVETIRVFTGARVVGVEGGFALHSRTGMSTADDLRALLRGDSLVHLPGAYDAVSARLAARAGAQALHLSGATVSAVELGVPDLGFVHGSDIARRAAVVASASGLPVLADADTGYGNALQARQTTVDYAAAGVAGLHLEDQVAPKRCGHLGGKAVVDLDEAAARVRAAVDAGTGLVVVARTDALSVLGADAVVERCRAFADAGVDAAVRRGSRPPRAGAGRATRCRGCRWSTAGPRPAAPVDAGRHRQPSWRRSASGWSSTPCPRCSPPLGPRSRSTPRSCAPATRPDTDRMAWSDLTDLLGLPGAPRDGGQVHMNTPRT